MKFTERANREFTDVHIPSLFINNIIAGLDELTLKVYLYIKFVVANNISWSSEELAKKFSVTIADIEKAIVTLCDEELLIQTLEGFELVDLKEQEINKTYIPKLKPVKTAKTLTEQKRIAAATAINDSFFQGIMTLGWYVDISTLFEKYGFEEEVMIALFHECAERKALKKNYVFKVAESWYKGGVKTFEQLEDFLNDQEEMSKIKSKIKSKLRLNRSFTEYEEEYIVTWIQKYKYTFDEIEHAIKKTLTKGTPSIGYIDGILKNWKASGYKNLSEITAAETLRISTKPAINVSNNNLNNTKINKQKEYQKDNGNVDFNDFYDNI